MAEKIVPACGGCICYVKDSMKLNEGSCHRYPPQIVSVSHKTLEGIALVPGAMFPQVGAPWWCGEFRPRAGVPAAKDGKQPS